MKKKTSRRRKRTDRDTMRPEYDFSSGVRGVTAARYSKQGLDMEKIAMALGAKRRGKVRAGSGYFGALQLAADVQARQQAARKKEDAPPKEETDDQD